MVKLRLPEMMRWVGRTDWRRWQRGMVMWRQTTAVRMVLRRQRMVGVHAGMAGMWVMRMHKPGRHAVLQRRGGDYLSG